MTDPVTEVLLSLIRAGIGTETLVAGPPEGTDWKKVFRLAVRQAVPAIALDGYSRMMEAGLINPLNEIPKQLKMKWIGMTIGSFEQTYVKFCGTIGRLAGFYASQGFKMMLIKGYGVGLNYPVPEHRPCGDIDIWLYDKYKEADAAVSKELGIKVSREHHHHTEFYFEGELVENHYDFINIYAHPSNKLIEKRLREYAFSSETPVEIDGNIVYLPSADFNALFLLRHAGSHFASTEMNLRQLLDWGLFIKNYHSEIDWNTLHPFIKDMNMHRFLYALNGICVDKFGLDPSCFLPERVDPELQDRVLADIISPEFNEQMPKNIILRVIGKYKRWRANSWKHKMVYRESLLRTFLVQFRSHLMKPASI